MEAPTYWLMILARFLQGVSSTVIWTVGLALLYVVGLLILKKLFAWLTNTVDRPPGLRRCDTAPEQHLGRQLGIASMGLTIGSLLGPPVAGVLYKRWGFRAPFIFGIIVTGIDLLARLLLIERHEAMRWGIDPMEIAAGSKEEDPEAPSEVTAVERAEQPLAPEPQPAVHEVTNDSTVGEGEGGASAQGEEKARKGDQTEKQLQESEQPRVTVLPHIALLKLMRSPRAGVCIILTFFWGLGWAGQEAALVLHMEHVWGLDPHQAGTAFIAAVVPTIFCEYRTFPPFSATAVYPDCVDVAGIPSGWLSDKYGPALIGCAALLLSLPWYGLITIEGSLAMFLTFFALEGEHKSDISM
jgi:DHA1 family solute carrier family 18 vesicular amine transporter 1/2